MCSKNSAEHIFIYLALLILRKDIYILWQRLSKNKDVDRDEIPELRMM